MDAAPDRPTTKDSASHAAKHAAAAAALDLVRDGMRLGLGTGSTAAIFVELLGRRVAAGLAITGVPTSDRTADQARRLGIPLATLDEMPELDLTIDGADEYDRELRLIKGGGGALLREKIVATASSRMVVIADAGKAVDVLGRFPLPIEVNVFGLAATRIAVERVASLSGCSGDIAVRADGDARYLTDGGHLILDGHFGSIPDPEALAVGLAGVPGVVEHGLFLGIANTVLTGHPDGTVSSLGHPDVR